MAKSSTPVKPWCPFCGQDVPPPVAPLQRKMTEFSIGHCQCGAVYVCDQTGHNVGAAMVECLVHACHDNWDLAWDLVPEEDYLTNRLENYDEITHQIIETRNIDGRAVRGVLYFVRVNRDLSELSSKISNEKSGRQTPASPLAVPTMEPLRDPKRTKQRASKSLVKELANDNNIQALVDLCFDDSRTLRFMQRLLYDPDVDKRMHYTNIIGQVCARYSTRKPGAVSDLLHRLYEACSDSAATHWGLIEAIGAIIAARSDIYGAFARHLLMYREVPTTRVPVLWALSEIARQHPAVIRDAPFYSLFKMLEHPDPATRGHAVLLFGLIKATEVQRQIKELVKDGSKLTVYQNGIPQTTTVGELARTAMSQLSEKGDS